MSSSKQVRTVDAKVLPRKTHIYYLERQKKFVVWSLGLVIETKDNIVLVTKRSSGRGYPFKIAYEDIRIVPESSLLFEIDQVQLGFSPNVKSLTDAYNKEIQKRAKSSVEKSTGEN